MIPAAPAGGAPAGVAAGPAVLDTAVERSPLAGHDGRSGARLERVRLADGTRLVVKRAAAGTDLAMRLSGDTEGRELCLWATGALDRLPAGVAHAMVGGWREGGAVVTVMRDLGDAVLGWDTPVGREDRRRIFAAAAAVHAAFAGRPPAGLCPLATRLSLFAPAGLRSLRCEHHPLVDLALRGWEQFADLVPADVAGAVAAVHAAPGPRAAARAARGPTLAHGDRWLVNVALEPDRVVLLDWNLATEAPGALDVATFLMGASALDVAPDDLLHEARLAAGDGHDEIALRLALLAAVADLGWNKALDAAGHADPAIRAREAAGLSWWVAQARRTLELGLV
ncbi:MAG: hypothetical protein ACT4PX_01165 [Actinomycetota bacterium]